MGRHRWNGPPPDPRDRALSQDKITPQCSEDDCTRPAKTRGLCQKHYHALWRAENKDHVREQQRAYAAKNADKLREYQRERYLANREEILKREHERTGTPEYRQRKRDAANRWRAQNLERSRENSRRWRIQKKYGLTLEEYEEILARGCAICGTHEGRIVGRRADKPAPEQRICIDHDHTTGKVRDALCHSCNTGLGSFGDDPARLRAAAKYLETHLS